MIIFELFGIAKDPSLGNYPARPWNLSIGPPDEDGVAGRDKMSEPGLPYCPEDVAIGSEVVIDLEGLCRVSLEDPGAHTKRYHIAR